MDRKNLLIGASLILVIAIIVILFCIPLIGSSNPELKCVSESITNFKTSMGGITPTAIYYWSRHILKLDKNSDAEGTYSPSNENIQRWAKDIQKNYPMNGNHQKGEAIFNYTYQKIVTKWHFHANTLCPINTVAQYHEANCAETSRIVYNLALALDIPKKDVRYVHRPGHYWVQINCNGTWVNVDASHFYDGDNVTEFGKIGPTNGVHPEIEIS
ncbi:MAG: hypothetical protein CVV28_08320 [Methanobacteriales archaeon HGW-Methanobacteriales-1]|jgi:hypothetical protein|nr:MAG: hypothetical protein CVV28_08320 [Methanobacteriales archaeon HGW-Methanobacteriales-1]